MNNYDKGDEEREELVRELQHAQSLIRDYQDSYERIINEQCAPDEQHCTCVPALRAEIKHLHKILEVFANPNNWTDNLQWRGRGSPISIAEDKVRLTEA